MPFSQKFKQNLITFSFIVIISYILDITRNKCKKLTLEVKINNLFHHIVSNFLWFGSFIFGFHEFHILYMIGGYIGWKYFDGCILTDQYNKNCNYDKQKKHHDLLYFISGNETFFEQMTAFKIIFMYNIICVIIKYLL